VLVESHAGHIGVFTCWRVRVAVERTAIVEPGSCVDRCESAELRECGTT
jgi:hypothetical protein